LRYNTGLGYTQADSGQGPPAVDGWVRTGFDSASYTSVGQSNCSTWTSSSSGHYGTYTGLPTNWTTGQDVVVWQANTSACDVSRCVWRVQNLGGVSILTGSPAGND
jgi:hypothetical protein